MIEIKITGETPMEALASITAFGLHCVGNKDVRTAAKRILDTELAKEAAGEPKLDTIAKGKSDSAVGFESRRPRPRKSASVCGFAHPGAGRSCGTLCGRRRPPGAAGQYHTGNSASPYLLT